MSEQPPALDPATLRWAAERLGTASTMRWLYERESCDWWGERPVAEWLRDLAGQAEQQAATPPDVRETAERALLSARWPDGSLEGFPSRKIAAMLVEALAAAGVLASTPRPEGETRVEWGVQAKGRSDGDRLITMHRASRAEAMETMDRLQEAWASGPFADDPSRRCLVRRSVTSFPDVVGEWVPVEQDGDDRG